MQRVLRPIRLIWPFVWRDLAEQQAGSWLGLGWSFAQPLFLVLVYWLVFATILQVRVPGLATGQELPFIVYLLSAFLPWVALQESIARGASAVVARRSVVKKVSFPVQIFPLATAGGVMLRYWAIYLVFLLVFFVWLGHVTALQLFWLPFLLALQVVMTSGLVLFFSALTVYLRDLEHALAPLLQIVFFTSPVLYPLAAVPESMQGWVYLNPYTVWAEAYHGVVLWDRAPSIPALIGLVAMAGLSLVLGRMVFRRLQPGFADVL
ncbi:MAG: ABC transporter permease [Chromatiales bacterium]|jgi:ABC-type polysaccharide/polyol phosphate export permease|nr:ABC transporter permease [Chromatiales bacterium]MDX9768444.1 ABC transporter permease [Ectothiorhodospiraceae bacterium]